MNPAETIPSINSSAAAWIEWHKQLKRMFGKSEANSIFAQAESAGRIGNQANTYALRQYLKTQGYTLYGDTWLEGAYDEGASTYGAIGGAFSTLGIFMILGVLIVVLLLVFVFYRLMK